MNITRSLAHDTSPAAEQRQIAFFRQRQPYERLKLTFDLTAFAVATSRAAIKQAHAELSGLEQARLFAALSFGSDYAQRIHQAPTVEGRMSIPAALLPVTHFFQHNQISYYVGGSIASTAYSLPRVTYAIDIAADLHSKHIEPMLKALEHEYYIERSAIHEALLYRDQEASFNITHHATGINIDIFVTAGRAFDQMRYRRAHDHIFPGVDESIKLASPEDIILTKLLWFRQNGIESMNQWRDVNSIIRVQGQALDLVYLQRWAAELHIRELLEAALRGEAAPSNPDNDDAYQSRMF